MSKPKPKAQAKRGAKASEVRADKAMGRRVLRFRLDTGTDTNRNKKHWLNADSFAPDKLMSAEVRKKVRDRARYEYHNNCYAQGIVRTLANDVVGTGPRLQVPENDGSRAISQDHAELIEHGWCEWAESVGLAEKLRQVVASWAHSGESFVIIANDERIEGPVKLSCTLVEPDRVTHGIKVGLRPVDGIEYDAKGNPVRYMVLPEHPGGVLVPVQEPVAYPADYVIHTFRCLRPEQSRGIPLLTPALNVLAQLRRFTEATLDAAETAARFAAVIETDGPGLTEDEDDSAFDAFELEPGAVVTMPKGYKLSQIDAKHPNVNYKDFKSELLNEVARTLSMPFNIAAGNSSSYNYASGQLDHQVYFKAIQIDQKHIEHCILNRLFAAWWEEAKLVEKLLPPAVVDLPGPPMHVWYWDGFEHVNPEKEANAVTTALASNTTTLEEQFARRGKDWKREIRQRGIEVAYMRDNGLDPTVAAPAPSADPSANAGGDWDIEG